MVSSLCLVFCLVLSCLVCVTLSQDVHTHDRVFCIMVPLLRILGDKPSCETTDNSAENKRIRRASPNWVDTKWNLLLNCTKNNHDPWFVWVCERVLSVWKIECVSGVLGLREVWGFEVWGFEVWGFEVWEYWECLRTESVSVHCSGARLVLDSY